MKIRCLCFVRDEADIIEHTLEAAIQWAYKIYVCDNGSTDGTWEIVQRMARQSDKVVAVGQIHEAFRDEMRGELAQTIQHEAQPGDWWCKLDADEIYAESPAITLKDVNNRYQVVHCLCINYYFTDLDLMRYEASPQEYVANWDPGWKRHYLANWAEVKFVRHRSGLVWTTQWPDGIGDMRPWPKRIPMKHYQYRTPNQIQRRIEIRRASGVDWQFAHEKTDSSMPPEMRYFSEEKGQGWSGDELWRARVVRHDVLDLDNGAGQWRVWEGIPALWGRRDVGRAFARRHTKRLLRSLGLYRQPSPPDSRSFVELLRQT